MTDDHSILQAASSKRDAVPWGSSSLPWPGEILGGCGEHGERGQLLLCCPAGGDHRRPYEEPCRCDSECDGSRLLHWRGPACPAVEDRRLVRADQLHDTANPDYSRSTKSKLSMLNKLPEKHYFFIIAIDKVDSAHCCLRIASKNILKVRLQRSFFLEGQRLMNNPG